MYFYAVNIQFNSNQFKIIKKLKKIKVELAQNLKKQYFCQNLHP